MSTDSAENNYCAVPLAPYAARPDRSLGRMHDEPESTRRNCFQEDRDRVINSVSFRRLKYKTQVFVCHEGDHYRTRLTHSLEVAQVARTLSRALFANEDLAETIALSHDLGHTPFAHLGEYALRDCMKPFGGFDHNGQSLRVLTHLERKYPLWHGLNLSWETLEGLAKHNGPIIKEDANAMGDDWKKENLSDTLYDVQKKIDLRLHVYASLEAQIVDISDDLAYNGHDVEDGLRAKMFTLSDVAKVPLIGRLLRAIQKNYPNISDHITSAELKRSLTGVLFDDVVEESHKRLKSMGIKTPEDVRMAPKSCVAFSQEMFQELKELREFLFANMYRHYSLNRMGYKVNQIITDLFKAFMDSPNTLPDAWQARINDAGGDEDLNIRAGIVKDYIAGMTDRFAIREHAELYDLKWA